MHQVAVRQETPARNARIGRHSRLGPIAALAAFVLLACLVKAPQLLAPMGQDQGLYHTIAEEILRGGVMYRDAWDPKPPGVFYTHAALLTTLSDPWRACQVGSLHPRCGTLLFESTDGIASLVLSGLVWLVARRLGFSTASRVLAFGFTAVFVNLALLDPEGSTPEKYALVPAVGAMLAGLNAIESDVESNRRRWLSVAGFLAAVAGLFKVPDMASLGALSVLLLSRHRPRDLLWLWVPTLLVLLAVWAAFAAMGSGEALLGATVMYNLGRFGYQSNHIPVAAVAATWQLFREGLAPLWVPAFVGVGVAWQKRAWRPLVIWVVFDVAALFLGGTKFTREYFVQLVPTCSLLAAAAIDALWCEQARGWLARAWLVISLAVLGLLSSSFQAGFTLRIWNEYVASGWTTTSVERLATMVASLPPQESLFVWGDEAELYALSGRLPTTRFLNSAGLANTGDPAVAARRAELLSSLTRTPPGVIVVDRRTADDDPDGRLQLNLRYVPELQQLLTDHYRPMDPAVLGFYLGGDREQVYIRQGDPDLCQQMPGCHLNQ